MFLYGFSSCTCLYEWLSICLWVFVMHISVRMTIHIILMGFCHVHVCTNDYPFPCVWVFVMHIPVRMTINFFSMGFRHAHLCTNDYPFLLKWFSSCTFLYKWLSISFEWVFVMYMFVRMTIHFFWMGFRHVHGCTNDYPFLFEWVFVMHISVRMTIISCWMYCRHLHFCMNDYHFFLMDCRHLHFCTNDYHFFVNGLSSFTFL